MERSSKASAHQSNELSAMKHNKNHDNGKAAGPQLIPVHFELTHPTATAVSVAGCFNHWQPEAKTLHPAGGGRWVKETALPPGSYEYCFVVDGQWMADPKATDNVPNPFGGRNSILTVAHTPDAAHLTSVENSPKNNVNQPKQQTP